MKYQAMSLLKKERYYVIRISVKEIKELISSKKITSKIGKKNVLNVGSGSAKWIEVELEMDSESFYGIGFLDLDLDSNFVLTYKKSLLEMDDSFVIDLKVRK